MIERGELMAKPAAWSPKPWGHQMIEPAEIAATAYYQVLLGSRPAEIITVLPRLNLGPVRGERLVELVRQWVEAALSSARS